MTKRRIHLFWQNNFNSHTREGVTQVTIQKIMEMMIFQLTHPWGCDTRTRRLLMQSKPFQLTHPWGCDSIEGLAHTHSDGISTHTPVRVWLWGKVQICLIIYFNSHTREGVTMFGHIEYSHIKISTHTPVRVWLYKAPYHISDHWYFNSHTREGVTNTTIGLRLRKWNFNSHTREGVTHML